MHTYLYDTYLKLDLLQNRTCCCCSVTQSCLTLCHPIAQVHVHCISDAIQPSHPLTPCSPSALNLSQHQGIFQWVSSSHQVAKWSFSFSISPSNEYSELVSFKIDWFDLLAVQGTLRSLLQYQSSETYIGLFWEEAKWFFKVFVMIYILY